MLSIIPAPLYLFSSRMVMVLSHFPFPFMFVLSNENKLLGKQNDLSIFINFYVNKYNFPS